MKPVFSLQWLYLILPVNTRSADYVWLLLQILTGSFTELFQSGSSSQKNWITKESDLSHAGRLDFTLCLSLRLFVRPSERLISSNLTSHSQQKTNEAVCWSMFWWDARRIVTGFTDWPHTPSDLACHSPPQHTIMTLKQPHIYCEALLNHCVGKYASTALLWHAAVKLPATWNCP